MGDKTKSNGKADEPAVEEQSSISELKSLGSTSSITIPRSSPLKKFIIPILALGVLGSGGYFFTATDLGKSVLGSPPADEELVKEDIDPNAAAPLAGETAPELDANGMPKEAAIPEGAPIAAPVPVIPVPAPVAPAPAAVAPAKVEAPVKKAAVVKAKSKKSKAALTAKSKKSKAAIAKSKAKAKKAIAAKKAKAKKPATQATVAPAHH